MSQKVSAVVRAKALIAKAKHDPETRAALERANEALLALRTLTPGQVHNDATLEKVSIQYRNEAYIGSQLMPTVITSKPSDKYFIYSKRDRLGAPDDSIATRSIPNEVSETRTLGNFSTKGYALQEFVDGATLDAQDAPLNEMLDAVAAVNDALDLKQELRHALVLTTAANFGGNTVTLAGSAQWSDYGATSNPYDVITTAREAIWNSATGSSKLVGYCGNAVFNKLRMHPQVVANFKHQNGLKAPTAMQLAEFFELDEILVGRAWVDTANEGQAASYGRGWGKHFGIVRVAQSPGIRQASFGYTFQFGDRVTTEWYDPRPGVKGGYYAKVGLQTDEKIVAADTGYLIVNAVA